MGFLEAGLGLEPVARTVEISPATVARVKEPFPMFRLHHREPTGTASPLRKAGALRRRQ